MHRRRFLAATALASAASTLSTPSAEKDHPLASFDREVESFMAVRKIPGGSLAVVKDGRLVHARGYGWADVEKQTPVEATSLFRIASISKPFTAVAALQLVEQGKLALDARVAELLPLKAVIPTGSKADARWQQITVRHCLQHTGGWLASAVDLARFAVALRDPAKCPLLKSATWKELHAAPPAPVSRNTDGSLKEPFYVCGWQARSAGPGQANYWHTGSLPGTRTLLVRRWDGLNWAVLFNQRQEIPNLPDAAIDPALHRAADAVKEWPKEDLFAKFA